MENVDTMDTKGLPSSGTHYKALGHVTIGKVCGTRWFNLHYKYDDIIVPVVYSHYQVETPQLHQPLLAASRRTVLQLIGKKNRIVRQRGFPEYIRSKWRLYSSVQ